MYTVSKRKSGKEAIVHADLTKKAIEFFEPYSGFSGSSIIFACMDDVIQGSIEEDNKPFYTNCAKHYFNPQSNLGLHTLFGKTSALEHAQKLWQKSKEMSAKDIKKSHYLLGRVIHLLEDMASPAHVLLVDHLFKRYKQRDGQMLDEDYLKRLKATGVDLNQDNMVVVLDQGDPYEEWTAQHSLNKLLKFNSPQKVVEYQSMDEIFIKMANEVAQAKNQRLIQVLNNNYIFDPKGNGHYNSKNSSREISNEDAGTLAYFLIPRLIEKVASLFELFEYETFNGPRKK